MAVREILQYPDPRLAQIAAQVTVFDADLARLANQLLETMYAARGRGLAAPQVGVMARVFVMDVAWKETDPEPYVLVNPVILWRSESKVTREEACLSIPDQPRRIARPDQVQFSWQDLSGALHHQVFEGFAATCAQHEMDHLEGRLILDHLEAA